LLRLTFCLLAALVLALQACGGDDSAPAATTPAATQSSATPRSSTTAVASDTPSVSGSATPTLAAGVNYTVQRGDTLYAIANRFGVTVDAIVQANGISDPSKISVGQVLMIPGGATQPAESPSPGAPAQVISRGDPTRMMVAFSFDAGSDVGYTSQILDTLAANGIKASFGMIGTWAQANPDLLRRIASEGHTLINHSWSHPSFVDLTQAQRWEELDRTEQAVHDIAGVSTKPYFRPPFGAYDDSVMADVGSRGYRYSIMWTVDSGGWQGLAADQIVQRCLGQAVAGAIYVFHVGSASQDGPALQRVIDGLRAAGYSIGSVPDVLA
jgi:peptidoglycan/xylan/chitin deacetylase (PgdA/CDA1 family)